MTLSTFARLAGLGALAAAGGLALGYLALVALLMRPSPQHGIDGINAAVAWISLGGLFAALIIAHVAIAKQLLLLAKGEDVRHRL
jgi:hypothetical protein